MRVLDAKFFYEHSERCRRVSVDVDNYNLHGDKLKVLRVYFALKNAFPSAEVSLQRTRKGHHVKAVGECIKSVPISKRVDLREKLGDDPQRIDYEYFKLRHGLQYHVDTLFDVKFYASGETGRAENMNPLAAPWASQIPARKPIS